MNCPGCQKEIVPDSYFCAWCSAFVPSPGAGAKAGLFARWVALVVDPLIAVVLFDKNGQAWHDKIAGTVVVKAAR